jgi:Glycosyl transferase family 2
MLTDPVVRSSHVASDDTTTPGFAVVIATRNRGAKVVATLDSIFANGSWNLQVVVVDQSDGRETEAAVKRFTGRPDFHYVRSETQGCSAGRNVGVSRASRELIAFTDDDCLVGSDWLKNIANAFEHDPSVAVVFGGVEGPATLDGSLVVTTFEPSEPFIARGLAGKHRVEGIAGCMAVRRSVWCALGGFDELMGRGAPFLAGEEVDFTIRSLASGYFVSVSPAVRVVHTGSVPSLDVPALVDQYWFGAGAAFGKSLKRRPTSTALVLMRMAGRWAFGRPPVASILGGQLQRGRRFWAFLRGLAVGASQPIDPLTGRFTASSYPRSGRVLR